MPLYGPLESLLQYAPFDLEVSFHPEMPASGDRGDALENLIAGRMGTLASILKQIGQDVGSRAGLSEAIQAEIQKHYRYRKTKLYEADSWQSGLSRSMDARKGQLEKQLDALNQEARQELQTAWQDIAKLR